MKRAALLYSNTPSQQRNSGGNDSIPAAKRAASGSFFGTLSFSQQTTSVTFNRVCVWAGCLVIVCLIAENVASTAYGRFGSDAKFAVNARLGWWLMEIPCMYSLCGTTLLDCELTAQL